MQELKKMKIWVLWRYAKVKGKITKVPFAASGGPSGTDDNFRETWVSYEEIQRAALSVKCDGIGFILPCGYFLLDIDHRDLDDPLMKTLLERFGNTYSERSVSGHGVHVLGKEKQDLLPTCIDEKGNLRLSQEFYQRNSKDHIELYHGGLTGRFATFSGNAINDVQLVDCTEAVLTTLDKNMRRPLLSPKSAKTTTSGLPADKLSALAPEQSAMTREELEAAAFDIVSALRKQKNSEKFIRLYDQGNLTGYGSQSEADMALCSIIAFRAGNNPQLIDYIFRGSKLYREKWEREDYREETIRKAILLCAGEFHPSALAHPPFVRYSVQKKGFILIPSLLAQYIRETVPFFLVQNNSKQATMMFVYENGCYKFYDKQMMLGKIKAPVEAFDIELVSMTKITEVYNQLISDRSRVMEKELNADEHLINFTNGLLEVTPEKQVLHLHSPEIKSTIQIPCAWKGEETATPVFDAYLDTLTNHDPALKQLMLEYMGMCFSNVKGWRPKKVIFLVGPGDTGKSVIKALVERILGDENYMAIDLQEIEARFGTGMIYGVRLAGSSDMSYMTVSELKTLKRLTGGDGIFAEDKGQKGFGYTYNGLLWFCMNRLPKFGGDDGRWVYERIMIVNCSNVVPREKQDKKLLDKLYAEREGIIYKAVMALKKVMENGYRYSEPESVIQARESYQRENNTAIAFFTECMCERKNPRTDPQHTVTDVYFAYLEYCRKNGFKCPKKRIEFRDTIMEYLEIADPKQLVDHGKRGTCYLNYMLTEEAREEYGPFAA